MNWDKEYIKNTYPEVLGDVMLAVGTGWVAHVNKITDTVVSRIKRYNDNRGTQFKLEILQIKEKFGGLRYYFKIQGLADYDVEFYNETHKYITRMETVVEHVCEACGMYGETVVTDNGWTQTLCDKHAKEDPVRRS